MENYEDELAYRLNNDGLISIHPVFAADNIRYEISDKVSAIHCGGIGLLLSLVKKLGLPDELNKRLNLLKVNKPYHDSDHILNMALNIHCGGKNIEAIEQLRNNIPYMNAIGAKRIPDPTTAGDFLRRMSFKSIEELMSINIETCQKAWLQTDKKFRKQAILDVDSTISETFGECKENMDISYKGKWGFHPLAITEATTGTHLAIVNRSANVSSDNDAAKWMNKSIAAVRSCFDRIYIRGDSGFRFYQEFDNWDADGVFFCLAMRKSSILFKEADSIDKSEWIEMSESEVPACRMKKVRVKEAVVVKRGFKNKVKHCDYVSEFTYQPGPCQQSYRVVVVKRVLEVREGQNLLFNELQYFFYITNITHMTVAEIVKFYCGRSNHENKIEQLKNGVFALKSPTAEFMANWGYMIICSLAWNMKSWLGMLSENNVIREKIIRMEFPTFIKSLINIPCQILSAGGYVVYRFLNYNVWLETHMAMVRHLKRVTFSTV